MTWIKVLWASYICLLLLLCLQVAWATRLGDIYWNSSNPIFRIDNTDHIIDVNKGNIPFEYDQVNIICPAYTPGTKDEDVETYIIYNVSKEEYDSCRITNLKSRIIAICDKPQQLMYFTITFRSFTPQPGGLEFRPGQDYYFISTSGGAKNALHQRIGGKCATHNMKVIFKVCCAPGKPSTTSTSTISSTSLPTTMATPTPITTNYIFPYRRPTTTTMNPPFRFPPHITSKYPILKSYDYPREEEPGKISSKKTEDRDKLPNETRAKNEELVNNRGTGSIKHPRQSTILLLLILTLYQLFKTR